MQSKDSIQTVHDGEYPFYEKDDAPSEAAKPKTGLSSDADTISSLSAVTATVAGPNKLVATGESGTLPTSTMPGVSGSFVISGTTYTIVNGVVTAIS